MSENKDFHLLYFCFYTLTVALCELDFVVPGLKTS
jgi:hypothetical protein